MVRGSAEAAASASASATTIATGKTTGGAATTNAHGTTGETIGAAGLDLAAPAFSTTVGLDSASTSLGRRRGRGEGEAGQRERGYKHGYGSWTRTVERVPRSRTRRIEPNPGSNSWIELVDTQRSRRMVQDGDWNPSNPPREGEWRSRAPASFAPQCSVRRPCHLVVSLSFSLSSVSSNRLAPSDAGAYESVCRERESPRGLRSHLRLQRRKGSAPFGNVRSSRRRGYNVPAARVVRNKKIIACHASRRGA